MKKEASLQKAVSYYLRLKHPNIVFTSESSGIRVGIGAAMAMAKQRSKHKLPDLIILEPVGANCGLMLELKTEENSPHLKNGQLSTDKHVQAQAATLALLTEKGYVAKFAVGYKNAIEIIEKYLSL